METTTTKNTTKTNRTAKKQQAASSNPPEVKSLNYTVVNFKMAIDEFSQSKLNTNMQPSTILGSKMTFTTLDKVLQSEFDSSPCEYLLAYLEEIYNGLKVDDFIKLHGCSISNALLSRFKPAEYVRWVDHQISLSR